MHRASRIVTPGQLAFDYVALEHDLGDPKNSSRISAGLPPESPFLRVGCASTAPAQSGPQPTHPTAPDEPKLAAPAGTVLPSGADAVVRGRSPLFLREVALGAQPTAGGNT